MAHVGNPHQNGSAGNSEQTSPYREILPDECPNLSNCVADEMVVMRMSNQPHPTPECFSSHAALGLDPGDNDPCEFASCSLFTTNKPDDFEQAIRRLPGVKWKTTVFFLKANASMGRYDLNKKSKHVNMWFFSACNPVEAVYHVQVV